MEIQIIVDVLAPIPAIITNFRSWFTLISIKEG